MPSSFPEYGYQILRRVPWSRRQPYPWLVRPCVLPCAQSKILTISTDKQPWESDKEELLQVLDLMGHQQQVSVNEDIFIDLLRDCIMRKSLTDGKRIHAHILKHCPHPTIRLSNTLINMYAKCGSFIDAHKLFEKLPTRNFISWKVMISASVQSGHHSEVLRLFAQMQQERTRSDAFVYINVLKACANLGDLEQGRQIHSQIIQNELDTHVFVGSTLIDMYAKCGSLHHAHQVFDNMPVKNVVSWSTMIAGYAHHGYGEKALRCFSRMEEEGLMANEVTFVSVLKGCANLGSLQHGKEIHARILKCGFHEDVFVGSTLVDMYVKCGSIELAREVFDNMHRKTAVSWTVMIAGYIKHEKSQEALDLFWRMTQDFIKPNKVTYMTILKACNSQGALIEGKRIHERIIKDGFESDIYVGSTLVDMYSKCGSLLDASKVFDKMPTKNVVTWNAMITGFIHNEHNEDACKAFWEMQWQGIKPDKITFTTVLKACASSTDLEQGKQIHMYIVKSGCELDVFVRSALVNMYAKCGSLELASKVFDEIPGRDAVSWNAIITAYAQHGHEERALEAFQLMQNEGLKPDKFTVVGVLHACANMEALELGLQIHAYIMRNGLESDESDILVGNALIDMYAKCRSIKLAQEVFNKMPKRDVISWTALITGYAKCGDEEKALKVFWLMQQEGIVPDNVTFATALNLCANLAALEQGKQIHADITGTRHVADIFVENSLVNMYAKCGEMHQAHQTFNKMTKQDVTSWNALITGYAQHGYSDEVLKVFEQMCQGCMNPDEVTFVSVLAACSHAGLLDEGKYYFNSMLQDHGVVPSEDHYACMIGLLGRFGHLQEAEECIHNMPLQPSAIVLMALLGASRIHGHLELARHSADCIFELEPQSIPASVLLSNIFSAAGSWDYKDIRGEMEDMAAAMSKLENQVRAF